MKFQPRRWLTALLVTSLVGAFGLFGCASNAATSESSSSTSSASATSSSSAEKVELQIFAANSLEKALNDVQDLYTKENPEVTFAETQYLSSGDLVTNLQAGAPADILITASKSRMDDA